MRSKGKVSRASEAMTVVRHFEPDMERQVRALLLVLGYTPKTTEGPGVEAWGNNQTQHTDCCNGRD